MELCASIVENSVTVFLPVLNTIYSKTKGVNNLYNARAIAPKLAGCYRVIIEDESYVGQARVSEWGNISGFV